MSGTAVTAPGTAGEIADSVRTDDVVEQIGTLVRCESPSDDLDALARCSDLVSELGTDLLGREPEHVEVDGYRHVRWTLGTGPARALILGHYDTVWPIGSLDTHPWSTADGVLRGPGCFDMKAGIVQAFHAVAALPEAARDGLTILFTADEETGAATSRELIEQVATGLGATFVAEPGGPDGALKTARKGMSRYRITATGRAAHAGLEPENGLNTTVELAHQIERIAELGDEREATTVTPTLLQSGTTANTVPDSGVLWVDVRSATVADLERVRAVIDNLVPHVLGVDLEVVGDHRPPLEREASRALYDRAVEIAAREGLDPVGEMFAGGVSDGNFTAGVGTPTLDGLGAVGGGAHADHEHVVTRTIPHRTALLSALLRDVLVDKRPATRHEQERDQ